MLKANFYKAILLSSLVIVSGLSSACGGVQDYVTSGNNQANANLYGQGVWYQVGLNAAESALPVEALGVSLDHKNTNSMLTIRIGADQQVYWVVPVLPTESAHNFSGTLSLMAGTELNYSVKVQSGGEFPTLLSGILHQGDLADLENGASSHFSVDLSNYISGENVLLLLSLENSHTDLAITSSLSQLHLY